MNSKIILIDAYSLNEGGGKRYILELLKNINLEDIDSINIVTRKKDNLLEEVIKNNKKILLFEYKFLSETIFGKLLFKLLYLRYIFKKLNCNYLFVLDGYSFFFPNKTIVVNQNILPFEDQELKKLKFSLKVKMHILYFCFKYSIYKSRNIIFLSDYSKNLILKKIKFNNLSLKTSVINHGVNHNNKKDIVGIKNKKIFNILYISSFFPYKNHLVLLNAINNLSCKYKNIHLTLIGQLNDYYFKILKPKLSSFSNLQLDNNLIVKNFIPMNKVSKYYNNSDLFVFPSSCENFPNILLEAMSSEIPVITSNYGPMKEIINNNSYLFKHTDVSELSDLIEKFILNENDIVTLNKLFCKKQVNKYNWRTTSKKTLDFIINE